MRRCALISPVVASLLTAAAFGSESPPTPASSAFTAQDAYALLWFASIVLGILTSHVVRRLVAVAMPAAHAAVAVHRCLRPAGKRRQRTVRSGIVDVLGERRTALARAAQALDTESGRIDLLSDHHPIASVLRGCTRHLRAYLRRTESLDRDYPPQVTTLLNNVIVVLAGPADQRFHDEVGRTVDAFDADGAPRPVLREEKAGRWTSVATRTAEFMDRVSRLGAAVWGLFTLVLVVVLIVTGTLDLSKIQLQK